MTEQEQIAAKLMLAINKLTPDIKGKAFDPDWFLLRQQLEEGISKAYRIGMTEAAEIVNNERANCQCGGDLRCVRSLIESARDAKKL